MRKTILIFCCSSLVAAAGCELPAVSPSSTTAPSSEPPASVDATPEPTEPPQPIVSASAASEPEPPMVELDAPEHQMATMLAQSDPRYRDVEALVGAKKWREARKGLASLATSEASGDHYERLVANEALEAWLLGLEGDRAGAHRRNGDVVALWKDQAASVARIEREAAGTDETSKNRRLGMALVAVGQASYALAEETREDATKLAFPAFRGPRTQDGIRTFTKEKLAPWMAKKLRALEESERAYLKVVELQPAPPPRWIVASAERVGTMWSAFVDDLQKAPVAREWEDQPELREAYRAAIDSMSAPLVTRAEAAWKTCVAYSDKFRIEDEHSRVCRAKLRPAP